MPNPAVIRIFGIFGFHDSGFSDFRISRFGIFGFSEFHFQRFCFFEIPFQVSEDCFSWLGCRHGFTFLRFVNAVAQRSAQAASGCHGGDIAGLLDAILIQPAPELLGLEPVIVRKEAPPVELQIPMSAQGDGFSDRGGGEAESKKARLFKGDVVPGLVYVLFKVCKLCDHGQPN